MNFNEKIEEMGYEITEKTPTYIFIEKDDFVAKPVILFDIKGKQIIGYLKPVTIVEDLSDISHQYSVFMKLQEDIKEFSKLSGYAII